VRSGSSNFYRGLTLNTRRSLVLALGAASFAAALGSFAQQQGKVWRVGFLSPRRRPASLDSDYYGAFPRRMKELGYVEGRNLIIEWRFADGEYERLPGMAAELVQQKVDVIMALGPPGPWRRRKLPPPLRSLSLFRLTRLAPAWSRALRTWRQHHRTLEPRLATSAPSTSSCC